MGGTDDATGAIPDGGSAVRALRNKCVQVIALLCHKHNYAAALHSACLVQARARWLHADCAHPRCACLRDTHCFVFSFRLEVGCWLADVVDVLEAGTNSNVLLDSQAQPVPPAWAQEPTGVWWRARCEDAAALALHVISSLATTGASMQQCLPAMHRLERLLPGVWVPHLPVLSHLSAAVPSTQVNDFGLTQLCRTG